MPEGTLHPSGFPRRSPVYRSLADAGAVFMALEDAAVAASFGADAADEARQAAALGLADLSPLPRVGFKGRATLEWLAGRGVAGIAQDNMAYPQADGSLIARLAPGEVLALGDIGGRARLHERLLADWQADAPTLCYPVMRRDGSFWFHLSGEHAAATLAKLCAVDLRPHKFPGHAVAQTVAANLSVIVVRQDIGETHALHILGDSASARYFWHAMLDAMHQLGGRPVGLLALRALAAGGG